jgi:hypothetical protein
LVSKTSEYYVDFENVDKNTKRCSLKSYRPLKCRKVGILIFPLLLLLGKSFLQITFWGVTSSKYLNGFEILKKFCVFCTHMSKININIL